MAKLEPMMGTIVARLQARRSELDIIDDLLREREWIDAALAAASNGSPFPSAAARSTRSTRRERRKRRKQTRRARRGRR